MHVLFNRIELMFDICFGLATDYDPLLLLIAGVCCFRVVSRRATTLWMTPATRARALSGANLSILAQMPLANMVRV